MSPVETTGHCTDHPVPRPEMCGEVTCSMQLRLVEESLLVFAVPMSWFYLMFFAG